MKATLYKLKEGWVLCSKEYIEPSSLYLNNGVLFTSDCTYDEGNDPNSSNPRTTDHNYKVLTQSPDLSSLLPDEQKEVGWFDLNTLSFESIKGFTPVTNHPLEARVRSEEWKRGFQKALELTADRRFTEEDINKALMSLPTYLNEGLEKHNWIIDKIKSLSQPKSWEVEYEEVGGVYKVVEIIKPQLLQ